MTLKLIAGLGNPGPKYDQTRHNAGFWFLEALASQVGADLREDRKFAARVASANIAGEKVWLCQPQTFMNKSGGPVAALASYYKVAPSEILIAYDDLDLDPGVLRFKAAGGHGGHNGLRDLHRHLGADYNRFRIGIGHPGVRDQVTDYVLTRPSVADARLIEDAIDRGLRLIDDYVRGNWDAATKKLHTKPVCESKSSKDSGEESGI